MSVTIASDSDYHASLYMRSSSENTSQLYIDFRYPHQSCCSSVTISVLDSGKQRLRHVIFRTKLRVCSVIDIARGETVQQYDTAIDIDIVNYATRKRMRTISCVKLDINSRTCLV